MCMCREASRRRGEGLDSGSDMQTLLPQNLDYVQRQGPGENLAVPGSQFLGAGYDLYAGNPEGDDSIQLDPGLRVGVVQLDTTNQSLPTKGNRWLAPTQGYAYGIASCNMTSQLRR